MARITRRRLVKLSASGAVAAQTGGLAAVLATGPRRPSRRGPSPLAALGRFRTGFRRAAQRPDHTGMSEGDRHHAQGRNHQRQRSAGAHYLGDPVGNRTRHYHAVGNWPQLYAESLADVGDVAEEIGRAQGGYYDVNKLVATAGNKWIGVPWIVLGGLIAYRKSWFERSGTKPSPKPGTPCGTPARN
jgi:hypothetical protein